VWYAGTLVLYSAECWNQSTSPVYRPRYPRNEAITIALTWPTTSPTTYATSFQWSKTYRSVMTRINLTLHMRESRYHTKQCALKSATSLILIYRTGSLEYKSFYSSDQLPCTLTWPEAHLSDLRQSQGRYFNQSKGRPESIDSFFWVFGNNFVKDLMDCNETWTFSLSDN
jgi:hypothetical protein